MSKGVPEYIRLPLDEIEVLADNPRDIKEDEFKKLCKDIQKDPEFLLQRPPLINFVKGRNICYAGNQRVKAAIALGYQEIHVWRQSNVPKKLQDERMMKDNLHRGEWNFEALQDFNLEFLLDVGFSAEELSPHFNEIEAPEEENFDLEEILEYIDEPVTKPGDIYQMGNHRLMCCDSRDMDSIKKLMKGKKARLCSTDPPYNVDYEGGTRKKLKIQNDNMDGSKFHEFLLTSFSNIHQVMESGSMIYVFHADTEGVNFRTCMVESGFKLSQCCIWVKNSIVMGRQDYHWQHEPILVGWKEGCKHRWYGGRNKSTVWNFNKPLKSEDHPTMKPVELINYTIANSSVVGDIVIDFFGGSGTTIISCETLNRHAYVAELDPIFCDVIIKRWELLTGKKAKLL